MKKEAFPLAEKQEASMPEVKGEEVDPKDYEVDAAMEDMLRAQMHRQKPKLMDAVMKKLGKKKEAINSIVGLKAKRAKLQAEDV